MVGKQSTIDLQRNVNGIKKHSRTGKTVRARGAVVLLPLLAFFAVFAYNFNSVSKTQLLLLASPSGNHLDADRPDSTHNKSTTAGSTTSPTSSLSLRRTITEAWQAQATPLKTPCPAESKKLYWTSSTTAKMREPIFRAIRIAGWKRTDDYTKAQIIWTDYPEPTFYKKLKPWQRYSQIPNNAQWSSKVALTEHMLDFMANSGELMPGISETYPLASTNDILRFERRLAMDGALDVPWVVAEPDNEDGVSNTWRIEPNSKQMRAIFEQIATPSQLEQRCVVTRGVCGELMSRKRNFDFQIYWLVASLDPLVVLYHDGFARVKYSNKFEEYTYLSTKDFFREAIHQYASTMPDIKDLYLHVKNQVKQILGGIAVAFKDLAFHTRDVSAENGFGLYAAKFVVDQDLDVFISELIETPSRDEDYEFRVNLHDTVFVNMFRLLENMFESDEKGLSLSEDSLNQTDGFEMVYNDGWRFEYGDYSRPKSKTECKEYRDVGSANFTPAPPRERYVSWKKNVAKSESKSARKTTPCPPESEKTFYMQSTVMKLYEPVARAFRFNGWKRKRRYKDAQVIWTDQPESWWFKQQLKPWQRYAQIPRTHLWDSKHHFVTGIEEYKKKTGKKVPAVPETYRLSIDSDVAKFQKRLAEGGLDIPWVLKKPDVNQGKGVFMLGPNSDELKNVLATVKNDKEERNYIIQRYVCNEMTIDRHKFDFRIFWLVASLDPLIVLYHNGYVRVGNSVYDETDFNNTSSHLTTHTFLSTESKKTWDEFKVYIIEAAKENPRLKHIQDPFIHVTNQIKQLLAEVADAYKNITFHTGYLKSENAFALHAGDFVVDKDLDVYIIEGTDGPGKDEDYRFRIEMHDSVFGDMVAIVNDITELQALGQPVHTKDLNLGNYEVIYEDGWLFEYEGYQQVKNKKSCGIASKS